MLRLTLWLKRLADSSGGLRGRVSLFLLRRRHDLHWNYLRNPSSRRSFARQRVALNAAQHQVVRELRSEGVSLVSFTELGADGNQLGRLRETVDSFARSLKVKEAIRNYAAVVAQGQMAYDAYIVKLNVEGPTFALDNPLLQLGLDPQILGVVNSYLGLWSKLIYADVWHSIPIDVGRRIGSQRWHRDPEDRKIVKIYLYFSNVDQGSGPLEYVPGSGFGGRYEKIRKWKARGDRYPPDGELESRIPASECISCVGPVGTTVFCDTSGFHRGGIATTSARIVATWTFCTPAAISVTARRRYTVDYGGRESELSPAARFALT
ncbi:MAG TPA: hypothetical protein VK780_05060 [Thermoanaerobaculia bacterium]|nr:hypothetical protein [Thermoanaerobaculia bacterium]